MVPFLAQRLETDCVVRFSVFSTFILFEPHSFTVIHYIILFFFPLVCELLELWSTFPLAMIKSPTTLSLSPRVLLPSGAPGCSLLLAVILSREAVTLAASSTADVVSCSALPGKETFSGCLDNWCLPAPQDVEVFGVFVFCLFLAKRSLSNHHQWFHFLFLSTFNLMQISHYVWGLRILMATCKDFPSNWKANGIFKSWLFLLKKKDFCVSPKR